MEATIAPTVNLIRPGFYAVSHPGIAFPPVEVPAASETEAVRACRWGLALRLAGYMTERDG